jgi:PAS domain S-box-containing protein
MLLGCCCTAIGSASGYISFSDESLTTDKAVDPDWGGFRGVGDPSLALSLRGMRDVVCRSGQVVYSNRFSESPWSVPLPAGAAPLDNVLLAPLNFDAKTIGVLALANKPGGFTDDDARRARQFGELVASGLELNRLSESVEEDDARFRAVCAIVTDAIVSIDSRGLVKIWSRSAEQVFGRSEQEAVGAPLASFLAERSRASFCGRTVPCPTSLSLYALRPNGEEIPIEFTCARWESEKPHLCTAIVREVTERQPEEKPRSVDPLEFEQQVRDRTADLVRVNHALQQEIAERARASGQLEIERSNLRSILHAMQDGVTIIGPHHDVEYANPALERDFGPVGDRSCYEYFYDRRTVCPWCRRDGMIQESPVHREWTHSASGKTYDVFTAPLRRVDGTFSKLEFFHDVTERKRIEDELRQSRTMIERIADATPDIVYLYDLEQRTHLYINRRLTDVLGYELDEFARDGDVLASRIVHPEDRGLRAQRFARLAEAAHGELIESEYRVLSKGGEYRWLQLRETVLTRPGDGSVGQILGVARDITTMKRVERSILEASEAEQRRIGQDLHDGLGQVLTGVALVGKRLERRVERRTVPDPADIRQLLDLVAEAMGETKKLARGLFPVVLETEGLRAALEEHARDVTARFETLCVVEGAAGTSALPRFRAIHLFRIAQEAVHNAVRHGRAKKITITLRERAEETALEILDDGAGISDEGLIRVNGMGLPSMRYRARLIGATLDVRRHPDGGTILTCRLGEGSRPEESARAERTDSRATSPREVGPEKRHAER